MPPETPVSYSVSVACREIDALTTQVAQWAARYAELWERHEQLRECKERLRIRCLEVEGERDAAIDDLRRVRQYGPISVPSVAECLAEVKRQEGR